MARVAFGPRSSAPSWLWVGYDVACTLREHFDVTFFGPGDMPLADVVFVVKYPLAPEAATMLKQRGTRIIYAPVDYFQSRRHMQQHSNFLRLCDIVALHSEVVASHLTGLAWSQMVDHYGKYFLDAPPPFKQNGFALWMGAVQNLPYLLHFLECHRLRIPVRILTNSNCNTGRQAALRVAKRIGIEMRFSRARINGLEATTWTAESQAAMMQQAKAAIDIKGSNFNQQTKPPTKAQQFICSGVPLAMNASWSVTYFEGQGLTVPTPTDPRWLSRDYYLDVLNTAQTLRQKLTLQIIAQQYKRLIENALGSPQDHSADAH